LKQSIAPIDVTTAIKSLETAETTSTTSRRLRATIVAFVTWSQRTYPIVTAAIAPAAPTR
jgi:hypothetical protein